MPIIKKTATRSVTRKDDGESRKVRCHASEEGGRREGEGLGFHRASEAEGREDRRGDARKRERGCRDRKGHRADERSIKGVGTPRAAAGVTDLTSTVDASSDG